MRSHDAASVLALSKGFGERVERMRREVARVIVGQDRVVDELLMTLLAGGHALIEGVPGLAKTLLVNTLSQALSLDSGRVQHRALEEQLLIELIFLFGKQIDARYN